MSYTVEQPHDLVFLVIVIVIVIVMLCISQTLEMYENLYIQMKQAIKLEQTWWH